MPPKVKKETPKKKAGDSSEKRQTRSETKKKEPAKKPTRATKTATRTATRTVTKTATKTASKTAAKTAAKGKGKAARLQPVKIPTKPATSPVKVKNKGPKKMITKIEHGIKANLDPKGTKRSDLKNWINGRFIYNSKSMKDTFEKEFNDTIKARFIVNGNHQRVALGPAPPAQVPKKAPTKASAKKATIRTASQKALKKDPAKKTTPKKAPTKKKATKTKAPKKKTKKESKSESEGGQEDEEEEEEQGGSPAGHGFGGSGSGSGSDSGGAGGSKATPGPSRSHSPAGSAEWASPAATPPSVSPTLHAVGVTASGSCEGDNGSVKLHESNIVMLKKTVPFNRQVADTEERDKKDMETQSCPPGKRPLAITNGEEERTGGILKKVRV